MTNGRLIIKLLVHLLFFLKMTPARLWPDSSHTSYLLISNHNCKNKPMLRSKIANNRNDLSLPLLMIQYGSKKVMLILTTLEKVAITTCRCSLMMMLIQYLENCLPVSARCALYVDARDVNNDKFGLNKAKNQCQKLNHFLR